MGAKYLQSPRSMALRLFLAASFNSFLVQSTLAVKPAWDPSQATFNISTTPIQLGEVFFAPELNLIAWLPTPELEANPINLCVEATAASNNALFTLGGIDNLQIHDYFGSAAYLTREGTRFAECQITPGSRNFGNCEGNRNLDCEGGHKFAGLGTKKWTCWVIQGKSAAKAVEEEPFDMNDFQFYVPPENAPHKAEDGGKMTDPLFSTSINAKLTPIASNPVKAAFTPQVTKR